MSMNIVSYCRMQTMLKRRKYMKFPMENNEIFVYEENLMNIVLPCFILFSFLNVYKSSLIWLELLLNYLEHNILQRRK